MVSESAGRRPNIAMAAPPGGRFAARSQAPGPGPKLASIIRVIQPESESEPSPGQAVRASGRRRPSSCSLPGPRSEFSSDCRRALGDSELDGARASPSVTVRARVGKQLRLGARDQLETTTLPLTATATATVTVRRPPPACPMALPHDRDRGRQAGSLLGSPSPASWSRQ